MTDITPNFAASWDALDILHPGRLRTITAIPLEKGNLPTETFAPDDRGRFMKWVKAAAAMPANIYFSVGEPMGAFTKKLERTDIKAVHWLHVDVDPENGKDIAQERERILAMLRTPPDLPQPTVIISSGSGYQAFWKLSEPLKVDGDFDTAVDLACFNIQIQRLLDGADSCQDISRIMRLPGTVNVPNARKVKKGRKPALAELVEYHADRVYDISKFVKAPLVQSAADVASPAPRLKAPANINRLSHIDELGDSVSDSAKITIVNGNNPDDPNHFPSRSEALFWCVCEMVRGDIDDETIYSVITDPDFKISESVLEMGNGTERYALRQIERAKEQAVDPALMEMNDRHAVIENMGGKCLVIEEQFDEVLGRHRLTKQSFDNFRNRYMHIEVIGGEDKDGMPRMMPAGEWWLRNPKRRQYRTITFAPAREIDNAYNLWRGFGCEARPGDCSLFLDHIKNIVCSGNEEYYRWYVGWMAQVIQKPGQQGHSAIVMRGRQGSGKSIIPTLFGKLFGRHYVMVNRPEHLVGNFNAHLRDCVLLFADEAFFAGDKKNESVLKTIITEPMLAVEAKSIDTEMSPNCIHLMMASNEKWVVPTGADDRRFFVLDILPDKVGDTAYFESIVKQMENGGYEALLHYLMTYDLSDFNVRAVPKTDALREQKTLSMDPDVEWWMSVLRRGTLLPEHGQWHDNVSIDLITVEYTRYGRTFHQIRRGSASRLEMAMGSFIPGGMKRYQRAVPVEVPYPDGVQTISDPWYWKIPPLDECRKHFDENFGGPFRWEADFPAEEIPDYNDIL